MRWIEFTVRAGYFCMLAHYRSCAGFARLPPYRHPPIFDSCETPFVIRSRSSRASGQSANLLVTSDQHDKRNDRQQEPPSRQEMWSGGQPCHNQEDDSCGQTQVANKQIQLFIMLEPPVASFETTFVLLGGIHFSGAQVFTSEDMLPKSEFKPEPRPNRAPRSDRMNVLDASRGSEATFRQKSSQMPSCLRYCSTLER